MGGKGSGGGRGYSLPLQLTKEMKVAHDRLKVQEDSADDFPIALKIYRAGLIVYGVLDESNLQKMYLRQKVGDDEAQFLMEKGLTQDFRPVKVEPLFQSEELAQLNKTFADVITQRESMTMTNLTYYVEKAGKYPMLPNARRLLDVVKAEARTMEVEK